jgi:hypothetical protein
VTPFLKRPQKYDDADITRQLVALLRNGIVTTRIKLASSDNLSAAQVSELWRVIDAQEWLIRMVANDYKAELEQIDRELESELIRSRYKCV